MRKSLIIITGIALLAAFGFGQTVVSVVSTSVPNGTTLAALPVNMANAETVGGLQFSLKDIPNVLTVAAVSPFGRTDAEPFDDFGVDGVANTGDFGEGDGQYTPGEPYEDLDANGEWDSAFSVEFNDRDTTVSVLIFDPSGRSIIPGNEPICQILFSVPTAVADEIVGLDFHEILNADPEFLLVVTDPDGNAIEAVWQNGYLTVGGIEFAVSPSASGTPGYWASVEIEMANGVPVKGFQFNLVDLPDYLALDPSSVSGIGRAADWTVVGNDVNGQALFLGIHLAGNEIMPGAGPIIAFNYFVAPEAPVGEDIPIDFVNLIVASEGGIPLPSNGLPGMIGMTTSADEEALPEVFALRQNYPNPFNPSTSIQFDIPEATDARLAIYNVIGQEIRTLTEGNVAPGVYEISWDGNDQYGNQVVSGVYFYRLTTSNGFMETRKLVKLK